MFQFHPYQFAVDAGIVGCQLQALIHRCIVRCGGNHGRARRNKAVQFGIKIVDQSGAFLAGHGPSVAVPGAADAHD